MSRAALGIRRVLVPPRGRRLQRARPSALGCRAGIRKRPRSSGAETATRTVVWPSARRADEDAARTVLGAEGYDLVGAEFRFAARPALSGPGLRVDGSGPPKLELSRHSRMLSTRSTSAPMATARRRTPCSSSMSAWRSRMPTPASRPCASRPAPPFAAARPASVVLRRGVPHDAGDRPRRSRRQLARWVHSWSRNTTAPASSAGPRRRAATRPAYIEIVAGAPHECHDRIDPITLEVIRNGARLHRGRDGAHRHAQRLFAGGARHHGLFDGALRRAGTHGGAGADACRSSSARFRASCATSRRSSARTSSMATC